MTRNHMFSCRVLSILFLSFVLLQNPADTRVLEENSTYSTDVATADKQEQKPIKPDLASKVNSELTDQKPTVLQTVGIEPPIGPVIPEIARGYEEIYLRFLKGVLIYRPTAGSEVGQIVLPISQLMNLQTNTLNPLEGTFDLSKCGDAGKYLSISTGYRKGKKAENADKLEIWIVPKFMMKSELSTVAKHYQPIQQHWSSPIGIFWSNGKWDNMDWYDYLTTQDFDVLSNGENLYEKWKKHQYHTHRTPDFSIARLISMYRIHVASFFNGPSDTHTQHSEKFYLKF